MPNIKSAIKRVKVSEKKNLRNRMIRSSLRTASRKYVAAIASSDVKAASALLPITSSAVDRAATKGIIHKNAANRRKSRMAKNLNKIQQA